MSWIRRRNPRSDEIAERLAAAEEASESVAVNRDIVDDQLSLVERLARGWDKVHERNHLAELFDKEWGRIR